MYLSGQWNLYAYSYNNPVNYIDTNGRLGHIAAGCLIGGATVGVLSAGIAALQGSSFWCSAKAGFGGAVGGCAGGALGALSGGGFFHNIWTNGLGNVASSGTNMLTGVQQNKQGVTQELLNAFEDGAMGGLATGVGARTGSQVLDDIVGNAATTGATGAYNAARNLAF